MDYARGEALVKGICKRIFSGLPVRGWLIPRERTARNATGASGRILQTRVAETRDVEAIASVINAAFRQAESFLIDRDRVDLATVRELLQTGSFLVAEDLGFL